MHYQVPLFRTLAQQIESGGGEFVLVSGRVRSDEEGRVGLSHPIVPRHLFITFREFKCGAYTIRWQPDLFRTVQNIRPDVLVVMGHVGDVTYWRLGALRRLLGYKYVSWQCGYEYNPGPIKHAIARAFLSQFDFHLAYHSGAREYLISHGVAEKRVKVVHNTINENDIDRIPRATARGIVLAELNLPAEKPIILYVGAILAEKRVDAVIDAIQHIGPERASLIVVGSGPALESLKAASTHLWNVKYPGRVVSGVGRFFDAADIFVLPGTGGLAINEAMAHGLPIVASNADGSGGDLVSDGVNGYLLRSSGSKEIADRLNILLNDPDLRLRMGKASLDRITTAFSFKAFADRVMVGLYRA